MARKESKQKRVLTDLFKHCQEIDNYIFHNELVKKISQRYNFSNPFTATKIDHSFQLPRILLENDYFITHLGKGYHQFIKGIANAFHKFEEITDIVDWKYQKSLLNEFDTSESNFISISFNKKIIHDFVYEDTTANPQIYSARRTKSSIDYFIQNEYIQTDKVQIEIDLTTELNGFVTAFEGKNYFRKDFAIYQVFNPFLYFQKLKKEQKVAIKEVNCCYILRKRRKQGSIIRLYKYTFTDQKQITSIKLLKSRQYNLIQR